MSTNTAAVPRPVVDTALEDPDFAGCIPTGLDVAKVMSVTKRNAVWEAIYKGAGIASQGEAVKKAARCAVYMYFAANGTSDIGSYHGEVVSGKGTKIKMEFVVSAIGKGEVRRFARSNAAESVEFHRKTGAYATIDTLRVKCYNAGVPVADILAVCDWLDMYEGLTPSETAAQAMMKNAGITRSRHARSGQTTATEAAVIAEERFGAVRHDSSDPF